MGRARKAVSKQLLSKQKTNISMSTNRQSGQHLNNVSQTAIAKAQRGTTAELPETPNVSILAEVEIQFALHFREWFVWIDTGEASVPRVTVIGQSGWESVEAFQERARQFPEYVSNVPGGIKVVDRRFLSHGCEIHREITLIRRKKAA